MFRLGIIGCGRIVEEAHAPALSALTDRAVVAAIADPSAERRSVIAQLIPSVAEYSDWDEMLRNEQLDIAVIAVPHHLHLAAIRAAAAAGLDVISEKPLANTLDEVDEIAEAIQAAGVRLSVMHNWMYNPDARAVVDAVAQGRIGEPFLVRNESVFGAAWKSKDPAGNWRLDAARAGGGIVIDAVYHPIYVAEAEMQSPIVRVFASLSSHAGDVEDTAVIVLDHENGGVTSIQRSHVSKGGGAGAHEVHGSAGSLRFRQTDPRVLNLIMEGTPPPPPPPGTPAQPALEIFGNDSGEWRPIEVEAGPWWTGIRVVFEETFAAWTNGADAPAGLPAARHVLEVVTAIYESAERGKAVEIITGGART